MKNFKLSEVSQSGIKELLRERLQNPEEYAGRPLVIWRSYYFDGIQERLAREVLKERNSGLPKEEWKGVLVNPKIARKDRLAFVAIDTLSDYEKTIANFEGVPFIVYAAMANPDDTILKDFPNAGQYVFSPDYREWADWYAAKAGRDSFLFDFIEHDTTGQVEDITYRWYNYFNGGCTRRLISNGVKPDENTGCDFPSCWQLALSRLRMAMRMARIKKLSEVNEDIFNLAFPPGISEDLVTEFRKYITEKQL